MNVIEAPVFGWLEKVFVCRTCGARVTFDLADLGSVQVHLRPRQTMAGTWVARASCGVCKTPMATFTQEAEMLVETDKGIRVGGVHPVTGVVLPHPYWEEHVLAGCSCVACDEKRVQEPDEVPDAP